MEVNPRQPAEGMARQVLTRYDRNKDGRLTRAESGLDEATFKALDANKDGKLDAKELAGFFRRDADLELVGHMGKLSTKTDTRVTALLRDIGRKIGVTGPSAGPNRTEVFNPTNRPMALAGATRRINGDTLALTFGDTGIEVATSGGGQNFRGFGQFFMQQFKMADTTKKGVIDRKQAMMTDFLDQIFLLADGDADGKLTEKELTAYLAMQGEGANCFTTLSIQDQGRSLFELFDADHDSRLSVRELRTAWSRLAPLARGGALATLDVPRRIQVSVGQGQAGFRGRVVARAPGMAAGPRRSGKPAPLWFQKMDRNNDGDLSPREFLGTEEDFRKLDADGDGLISAEEARQADARLAREAAK
jgi:Ca2+-binding EF-hand superfamily protein